MNDDEIPCVECKKKYSRLAMWAVEFGREKEDEVKYVCVDCLVNVLNKNKI